MRRLVGATAVCVLALAVGAGCTSAPHTDTPTSTRAGPTTLASPPSAASTTAPPSTSPLSGPTRSTRAGASTSSSSAPEPRPEEFGREHISLSCDDSAGDLPTEDSADDIILGGADLTGLRGRQDSVSVADAGLVVPPGGNWYFRKTPVYVKAGAGPVTLTIHGAGQFLSWVPASVWTNGSRPDLAPWAATSVTLEGCADRGAMYLGGLLATDPSEDFLLATSGGLDDFAAQVSLEAGGRMLSAQPVVDGCDHARPGTVPTATDAVIGPLSYGGLRQYATSPVGQTNLSGGYFYKSGAHLPPGASATVTIDDSAAGYAAIVTETGPPEGSRSVTYRSCRESAGSGFWWVGGFVLFGRSSACVPVTVTEPSSQKEHRAVVSLGAGQCSGT